MGTNEPFVVQDDEDQKRLRVTVSDELQAVMAKHGVGGVILLGSQTSGSWRVVLPQWAGVKLEGDGAFRIKFKKADGPALAEATVHFLYVIARMCTESAGMFRHLFEATKAELERQGSGVDFLHDQGVKGRGES